MSSLSDLKVEILTGPDNFAQWLRSFRVAAVGKSLWQVYSGEEPVLYKPRFHTMLVEAPPNDGKIDVPLLELTYRVAAEEWSNNSRRVHLARSLMASCLDPVIRDEVQAMDPDCFPWSLTKKYKLRDVCALEIAEIKLAQLTFNTSESVMTFVNKDRTLHKDIINSRGTCSDAMVMEKITRSLPTDRIASFITGPMSIREYTSRLVCAEFLTFTLTSWAKNKRRGQMTTFQAYGQVNT